MSDVTSSRRVETSASPTSRDERGELRRTLTLPWLVFYGVGVTVGAGIFALIGELIAVAGPQAPLAFLLSGVIAGTTGVSYMQLVRRLPRAGGEAIWVSRALGQGAGTVTGLGVITAGVVSSAVVALAFGGYLAELVDVPARVGALLIVWPLVAVACRGVRESVALAALVTLLEVGTLALIAVRGIPDLFDGDVAARLTSAPDDGFVRPVLSGAVLAFFAFIGFEDIANMAEETVDPRRTAPRAIAWTLGISVTVYVVLAMIAVNVDDPGTIADSDAPMSTLFAEVTGRGAGAIATIAAIAMTNGILVQLVMASRVLYGMAGEHRRLSWFDQVGTTTKTPIRATLVLATIVTALVVAVPLVGLARFTSVVILGVFSLVNLSAWRLARGSDLAREHRARWVGLLGASLAVPLAIWQAIEALGA